MFTQNRDQMRQFFFDTWHKADNNQPLEPLEQLVANIIAQHPEYHALLNNPIKSLQQEFFPELGESNPFFHLGLHISIQEQIQTNRPAGIQALYRKLVGKHQDAHRVEHAMMDCLTQSLQQAQHENHELNEKKYLHSLKKIKRI